MFEKEANEYAKKWIVNEDDNALMQEVFKDGAEFGYNKANEWHYVKDGDLPPKTTLVLIKACGCFILGWLSVLFPTDN